MLFIPYFLLFNMQNPPLPYHYTTDFIYWQEVLIPFIYFYSLFVYFLYIFLYTTKDS